MLSQVLTQTREPMPHGGSDVEHQVTLERDNCWPKVQQIRNQDIQICYIRSPVTATNPELRQILIEPDAACPCCYTWNSVLPTFWNIFSITTITDRQLLF